MVIASPILVMDRLLYCDFVHTPYQPDYVEILRDTSFRLSLGSAPFHDLRFTMRSCDSHFRFTKRYHFYDS